MKKQLMVVLMAVIMLLPAAAMAMTHSDNGKKMDHSKMDHGKMSGMDMGDGMIVLPDVEVDNVMGAAHLMDVKAKMAEHGMKQTHHLMIGFMDQNGKAMKKGKVAVKVQSPDGKTSKAIKMMGMKGQFGADVTVDQPGMYMFMVGTKLADGKKRTFHLHFENK